MNFLEQHAKRIYHYHGSDCWFWIGAMTSVGYGEVTFRGRRTLAHRAMYEVFNGPIPDGLMILHSCDRPCCINPNHLRAGTQVHNMKDMKDRNRQSRGSHRPLSKLTENDVRNIKAMIAQGTPQSQIAEAFGISQPKISRINTGKAWSHLT